MSGDQAWTAVLAAAILLGTLAFAARRRRQLYWKAAETLAALGRAEKAVRLIASQRDAAVTAQNRAEALGTEALREHRSLTEARYDLAKRWESLPRDDSGAHAEQLRRVVRLHSWDGR
ncbi:hypothetical protein [Actinomadura sp. BRA 177]|uniref:hypothetical protein n=1 Tax=Actinomadura sp. BRA 177 TaxID=2745202 RepID=UPI0015958A40|nr:hypothetical protein [Actinomadura sp. BRA 177]NVI87808.1 hypothetical protein [Actinomadura sp. BRA 177]